MYEDYSVRIGKAPVSSNYESITVTFYYGNRECSVTCRSLDEVAAMIDDFSTDMCDYDQHLFVAMHGDKVFVPCNFSVQVEVKK